MKTLISYQELSNLILAKTSQQINISYVNDGIVKVSKEIKLPIVGTKSVGLNLSVVGFSGHDVKLKFESDVISKILELVNGLDVSQYADITGNMVVIHLDNIEKVKEALTYVKPLGISFTETAVETDVELII